MFDNSKFGGIPIYVNNEDLECVIIGKNDNGSASVKKMFAWQCRENPYGKVYTAVEKLKVNDVVLGTDPRDMETGIFAGVISEVGDSYIKIIMSDDPTQGMVYNSEYIFYRESSYDVTF